MDTSITALAYTYDVFGNVLLATSLNAQHGTVNQVENVYNGLGQLLTQYQEHSGEVNTSTSLAVNYSYTSPASGSLLQTVTYPSTRAPSVRRACSRTITADWMPWWAGPRLFPIAPRAEEPWIATRIRVWIRWWAVISRSRISPRRSRWTLRRSERHQLDPQRELRRADRHRQPGSIRLHLQRRRQRAHAHRCELHRGLPRPTATAARASLRALRFRGPARRCRLPPVGTSIPTATGTVGNTAIPTTRTEAPASVASYDAQGYTTSIILQYSTVGMAYDAWGRVVGVANDSGFLGGAASYRYDALGRQISSVNASSGPSFGAGLLRRRRSY